MDSDTDLFTFEQFCAEWLESRAYVDRRTRDDMTKWHEDRLRALVSVFGDPSHPGKGRSPPFALRLLAFQFAACPGRWSSRLYAYSEHSPGEFEFVQMHLKLVDEAATEYRKRLLKFAEAMIRFALPESQTIKVTAKKVKATKPYPKPEERDPENFQGSAPDRHR
jgi:hypothetical protein